MINLDIREATKDLDALQVRMDVALKRIEQPDLYLEFLCIADDFQNARYRLDDGLQQAQGCAAQEVVA